MTYPSNRVVVVILNWNGLEDTLECLSSLFQQDYHNYEVVVVDNGSTDNSVATITAQYPALTILQTGKNLGYAGGNNVGIEWAINQDVDFILLLNNDTIAASDLISKFVRATSLFPEDSVLGAKIFFYKTPDIIWFAGGKWNQDAGCFDHLGFGQVDGAQYNSYLEVDYITGCALFSRTQTFKNVGLLDERLFLTYEETDWCYRAREKGSSCFFVPEARLWHKVSSSFGGSESPLVAYFMQRNIMLWAKRHLTKHEYAQLHKKILRALVNGLFPKFVLPTASAKSFSVLRKNGIWTLATWLRMVKRNFSDPVHQATLMGLRDYYLGRLGNCPDNVRLLRKASARK